MRRAGRKSVNRRRKLRWRGVIHLRCGASTRGSITRSATRVRKNAPPLRAGTRTSAGARRVTESGPSVASIETGNGNRTSVLVGGGAILPEYPFCGARSIIRLRILTRSPRFHIFVTCNAKEPAVEHYSGTDSPRVFIFDTSTNGVEMILLETLDYARVTIKGVYAAVHHGTYPRHGVLVLVQTKENR